MESGRLSWFWFCIVIWSCWKSWPLFIQDYFIQNDNGLLINLNPQSKCDFCSFPEGWWGFGEQSQCTELFHAPPPFLQSYSSIIWSHDPTNTQALEICPRVDLPWSQWQLSFRPQFHIPHEFWKLPGNLELLPSGKKLDSKMEHFWRNASKELRNQGLVSPRL